MYLKWANMTQAVFDLSTWMKFVSHALEILSWILVRIYLMQHWSLGNINRVPIGQTCFKSFSISNNNQSHHPRTTSAPRSLWVLLNTFPLLLCTSNKVRSPNPVIDLKSNENCKEHENSYRIMLHGDGNQKLLQVFPKSDHRFSFFFHRGHRKEHPMTYHDLCRRGKSFFEAYSPSSPSLWLRGFTLSIVQDEGETSSASGAPDRVGLIRCSVVKAYDGLKCASNAANPAGSRVFVLVWIPNRLKTLKRTKLC